MSKPNPKLTEEKFQRIASAWENLFPDRVFGGYTLTQFKALWNPAQTARIEVDRLEDLLKQALAEREKADAPLTVAFDKVVRAVRGDDTVGGDDGALYEAMGFIPKSKRKTGTTRKKATG
jgi:hypothetical protein